MNKCALRLLAAWKPSSESFSTALSAQAASFDEPTSRYWSEAAGASTAGFVAFVVSTGVGSGATIEVSSLTSAVSTSFDAATVAMFTAGDATACRDGCTFAVRVRGAVSCAGFTRTEDVFAEGGPELRFPSAADAIAEGAAAVLVSCSEELGSELGPYV